MTERHRNSKVIFPAFFEHPLIKLNFLPRTMRIDNNHPDVEEIFSFLHRIGFLSNENRL
ncbi:hypothetical protein J2S08_003254 [Bacillus chungangensis]|uniref:Uncharacterized protein n=1 Tax=Bacillus chungangensis TaxID=587633 RepID=A0ABT9WX95_9BACI|nr:hypothetical protein [Bacillus chungangensis]